MSLLLDALQRASKDKEKAAQALANAAAAEALSEGKLVLTTPSTTEVDFPDLVPSASAAETLAMQAPSARETEPPPDAVSAPNAAAKPMELTLEMDLDAAPPVVAAPPAEVVLEQVATKSPPPAIESYAATAKMTGAAAYKTSTPQAAAAAIQKAYAAPEFTNNPPKNRRPMVLAGIAGLLGLAFASFMFGVWGDPEQLLGLTGTSSIAPASPPVVAVVAPAQEAASAPAAPVLVEMPVEPAAVGPATAAVIPAAPVQAAATPPRLPASTPKQVVAVAVPAAASPAKTVAPPVAVALRAATVAPVFAARARAQSALEQGYAALLAGRLDEASRAYAVALEANPGEPDALLGMAYIAHTQGQRAEAQNYYRKVLRQDPGNSIANAGLVALEAGASGARSAERAKELAARQPDSAAVQALAAAALVQEGSLPDAALAFARAQALEPGNPLHTYNLAVAYDKLGNYAQAAAQYDKALRVGASAPVPLGAAQVQAARVRLAQLRQSLGQEVAP